MFVICNVTLKQKCLFIFKLVPRLNCWYREARKNLHYMVGNLGGTKIPARCPLSKVAISTVPNGNKVPHSTKLTKFELSNALTEMFLDHQHDLLYSCSAYCSAHLGILLCCNEYTFLLYCVP